MCHSASRTGAPILLLKLLSYIRQNELFSFSIIIKQNGPLVSDFVQFGETLVLPSRYEPVYKGNGIVTSIRNRFAFAKQKKRFDQNINRLAASADIVFINSIASAGMLHYLSSFKGKMISYVHELEFGIKYNAAPSDVQMLMKATDLFLVPCAPVGRNLVEQYDVPEGKITRLRYPMEPKSITPVDIRKMINVPVDTFIVCACGTTDWRKGFDLFYQVARQLWLKRNKADFHFVWIGGNPDNPNVLQAKIELRNMGISHLVSFIPESSDVQPYIAAGNVFFLPSREDPYPLVVLDAASYEIPCICFDKGGGFVEFVEDDAGWIVPFMDIAAAADCIDHLIGHRNEITVKGKKAAEKLRLRHNPGTIIDELQKLLA